MIIAKRLPTHQALTCRFDLNTGNADRFDRRSPDPTCSERFHRLKLYSTISSPSISPFVLIYPPSPSAKPTMFGLLLPSRPVILPPALQILSPTQFAHTFPASPQFSHIVVFLLPGNELPADVAAAIYIQFPGSPDFKLLGAIGTEKQTAIFRVSGLDAPGLDGEKIAEVDMDADGEVGVVTSNGASVGAVTVGISIEPAATVATQLRALNTAATSEETSPTALALVKRPPSTTVLARRIIKNAFNFLASFAGGEGGNEVVPLKSFQEWWNKFERRIEVDPGFLERDEDG